MVAFCFLPLSPMPNPNCCMRGSENQGSQTSGRISPHQDPEAFVPGIFLIWRVSTFVEIPASLSWLKNYSSIRYRWIQGLSHYQIPLGICLSPCCGSWSYFPLCWLPYQVSSRIQPLLSTPTASALL